jgi:hypothetical protein
VQAGDDGKKTKEAAQEEYIELICSLSNTPNEPAPPVAEEKASPLRRLSRALSKDDKPGRPNLTLPKESAAAVPTPPTSPLQRLSRALSGGDGERSPASGNVVRRNFSGGVENLNNINPQQLLDDLR